MVRDPGYMSVSLDLDNMWSYMKTHGDSGWDEYPSYLDTVVPRVLEFLAERDLRITFFIVGKDASLRKNRSALELLARAGHEVGNHTFHHEPWLDLYTEAQIEDEIRRAEDTIGEIFGEKTIGFRGPGYSLSDAAVRVLVRRQYLFDASTLPTFIGPLARAFYFRSTDLTPEERLQRRILFGRFSDGFRPLGPYRLEPNGLVGSASLLEIPVTTMPFFRTPFHASYILYLTSYSPGLARRYLRTCLTLCGMTGVAPSYLLHPLDFLGYEDVDTLGFFPGMELALDRKLEFMHKILDVIQQRREVVTMSEHARRIERASNLATVRSSFSPRPSSDVRN
jgi:hypothetical protein